MNALQLNKASKDMKAIKFNLESNNRVVMVMDGKPAAIIHDINNPNEQIINALMDYYKPADVVILDGCHVSKYETCTATYRLFWDDDTDSDITVEFYELPIY